jgi:hypothetical protein
MSCRASAAHPEKCSPIRARGEGGTSRVLRLLRRRPGRQPAPRPGPARPRWASGVATGGRPQGSGPRPRPEWTSVPTCQSSESMPLLPPSAQSLGGVPPVAVNEEKRAEGRRPSRLLRTPTAVGDDFRCLRSAAPAAVSPASASPTAGEWDSAPDADIAAHRGGAGVRMAHRPPPVSLSASARRRPIIHRGVISMDATTAIPTTARGATSREVCSPSAPASGDTAPAVRRAAPAGLVPRQPRFAPLAAPAPPAALSGSPEYSPGLRPGVPPSVRGRPSPPCDRTHQTPRGTPFGRTALLSPHALVSGS